MGTGGYMPIRVATMNDSVYDADVHSTVVRSPRGRTRNGPRAGMTRKINEFTRSKNSLQMIPQIFKPGHLGRAVFDSDDR